MTFKAWIVQKFPNKGNNEHTVYSIDDMHSAFYAGTMHGTQKEVIMETAETTTENTEIETTVTTQKTYKAKKTSLIAQIIAALWVAIWTGKNFILNGGSTNDIIFSGFAIAACFSPVYFNMILDKIKTIKFGE
jgi:hypothetical protein